MTSNFKVLISTIGLVVACGGSNNEANSADDINTTAPAPGETPESTPSESMPPSDAAPMDGATPGDASPDAPTPPTSMRSSEGALLLAEGTAGKTGAGGKTGTTGTTGGRSSSTGGASSKGG